MKLRQESPLAKKSTLDAVRVYWVALDSAFKTVGVPNVRAKKRGGEPFLAFFVLQMVSLGRAWSNRFAHIDKLLEMLTR